MRGGSYALYHKKLLSSLSFDIDLCRNIRLACVCGGENFDSGFVGHMGTLVQFGIAIVGTRSDRQQASQARRQHYPERGWRLHQSDLEAARRGGREEEWRTGAQRHCYTQSSQPMSAGTDSVRIEYSTRHANH